MGDTKKYFFGDNLFRKNSKVVGENFGGVLETALENPKAPTAVDYSQVKTKSRLLRSVRMRENYFLIDADPKTNYTRIVGPNNENIDLIISTKFSEEHNSISGIVMGCPEKLSSNYGFTIKHVKVGDRIFFHHNALTIAKNANFYIYDEKGFQYTMIDASLVYCLSRLIEETNRTEIQMIGDWLLVLPEFEKESDLVTSSGIILKTHIQPKPLLGIVAYPGTPLNGRPCELQQGDTVFYTIDSDIDLRVDGKKYWRMRHKDILAKLDDQSQIQPIYNTVMILPDKIQEVSKGGIFIPEYAREKQNTGLVVKAGTPAAHIKGRQVIYNKHAHGIQVNEGGETYLLINEIDCMCSYEKNGEA